MPRTGRPREFDEDETLDAAMQLFWSRGYEPTSVGDLVDRTGVLRGSLYAAFGDKHALFLRALERYAATWHAALDGLASGDVLPGVRAAILASLPRETGCPGRGCLIGNTIGTLGEDPEVGTLVRIAMAGVESRLEAALRRGQATGEISDRHAPDAQARLVLTLIQGISLLGRAGTDPDRLRDAVEVGLAALEPAPTASR